MLSTYYQIGTGYVLVNNSDSGDYYLVVYKYVVYKMFKNCDKYHREGCDRNT